MLAKLQLSIEHAKWLEAVRKIPCELAAEMVTAGARFQVTAMSLTGEFGRWPGERCRSLLAAGLVHIVASDSHSPRLGQQFKPAHARHVDVGQDQNESAVSKR